MGDPAGIVPEITAKALSLSEIYELCRPLAVAEAEMIKEAVKFSKLDLKIHAISHPKEGLFLTGNLDVLDMENIDA